MLVIKPPDVCFFPADAQFLIFQDERAKEREESSLAFLASKDIIPLPIAKTYLLTGTQYVFDGNTRYECQTHSGWFLDSASKWTVIYPELEEHFILGDWIHIEIASNAGWTPTNWWLELRSPQFKDRELTVPEEIDRKAKLQFPPPIAASIRSALRSQPSKALELYVMSPAPVPLSVVRQYLNM